MANISKINFNGEALDIKDTHAREQIKHLTADNYTADVAGDYTVHAGNMTEAVTGTTTEKYNNVNTTVTGKWMVNTPTKNFSMADVATGADVTTAINAEAQARENADAELNARIDESKQYTHFVVIGDSYSNSAQTGTPLWYTYLEKQYGLTAYTNAIDGVGYSVGGENDFTHQIQKAAATLDVTKVKTVYIFGGLNDLSNTDIDYEDFYTYCNSTIEKAIELFPSSEIIVAGIAPFQNYNFVSGATTFSDYRATKFQNRMAKSCVYHGVKFINLEYLGLFTPEYFGPANSVNQKHPSRTGSAVIASAIMSEGHSYANFFDSSHPDLRPTISSGKVNSIAVEAVSPGRVSIGIDVIPQSTSFTIDWNGFPHPPLYFTLTTVGGPSLVGYYDTTGGRYQMSFAQATAGTRYYGVYTVDV